MQRRVQIAKWLEADHVFCIIFKVYIYLGRERAKASFRKKTSMWLWGEFDSALQLLSGMGK